MNISQRIHGILFNCSAILQSNFIKYASFSIVQLFLVKKILMKNKKTTENVLELIAYPHLLFINTIIIKQKEKNYSLKFACIFIQITSIDSPRIVFVYNKTKIFPIIWLIIYHIPCTFPILNGFEKQQNLQSIYHITC